MKRKKVIFSEEVEELFDKVVSKEFKEELHLKAIHEKHIKQKYYEDNREVILLQRKEYYLKNRKV